MQGDSSIRILLALILVCLVVLVFQGFGGDRSGRYKVSVIKSSSPWLMRVDTATGRVHQFRVKGDRVWRELVGRPKAKTEAAKPTAEAEKKPEKPAAPEARTEPAPEPAATEPAAAPPPPRRAAPVQMQPENQIEALAQAMAADNPQEIRVWAASQLGSFEASKAVPILVDTLDDGDAAVVVAAIQALQATGDEAAIEAIRGLLDHPDSAVKDAAREAVEDE